MTTKCMYCDKRIWPWQRKGRWRKNGRDQHYFCAQLTRIENNVLSLIMRRNAQIAEEEKKNG